MNGPSAFRIAVAKFLRVIEPWYDWGLINLDRMEGSTLERDSGHGDVRYFQLQWFGVHAGVQFGRTPKRDVDPLTDTAIATPGTIRSLAVRLALRISQRTKGASA